MNLVDYGSRTGRTETGQRIVRYLLLLSVAAFAPSCSDRALGFFFDIPPPTAEELALEAQAKAEREARVKLLLAAAAARNGAANAVAAAAPPRVKEKPPEIEKVKTWKEAEKFFPMDRKGRKGRPNWTEAVRQGIIKPRESVNGARRPPGYVFKYDFFIPTEEVDFEAYFPHSTHTEWLSCESCHPKIFPLRGAKMTKKAMKKGKFCGVCHRKKQGTAFWLRACDRCHLMAKD